MSTIERKIVKTYTNRNKRTPFRIDKDIPIKTWRKKRVKPGEHVAYPFTAMKITDSFGSPLAHRIRIESAATAHKRRHPEFNYTVHRTGPNRLRLWRIKS